MRSGLHNHHARNGLEDFGEQELATPYTIMPIAARKFMKVARDYKALLGLGLKNC